MIEDGARDRHARALVDGRECDLNWRLLVARWIVAAPAQKTWSGCFHEIGRAAVGVHDVAVTGVEEAAICLCRRYCARAAASVRCTACWSCCRSHVRGARLPRALERCRERNDRDGVRACSRVARVPARLAVSVCPTAVDFAERVRSGVEGGTEREREEGGWGRIEQVSDRKQPTAQELREKAREEIQAKRKSEELRERELSTHLRWRRMRRRSFRQEVARLCRDISGWDSSRIRSKSAGLAPSLQGSEARPARWSAHRCS